ERTMCCYESMRDAESRRGCGGCRLEEEHGTTINTNGDSHSAHLEGDDTFMVLARVRDGRVQKLRAFSPECALDPGKLPLYWIGGVPSRASLDWLTALVEGNDADDNLSEQAVMAIALH